MRRKSTAYYWRGKSNFGDLLNPLLVSWFSDVEVVWAPAATADVIVCGSVIEHLPPEGYRGILAGVGKMYEESDAAVRLRKATVLALRGPLTAKGVPGDYALGDPGLLANELVGHPDKQYNLGIVPHWSDHVLEHRHEFKGFEPRIIYPTGDPLDVLSEIGRCRKIVSSSLHGIIVADAFGIPRRTEVAPIFQTREGGMFKFRDHNEAVGVPFEVGVTQVAPRYMTEMRQQELYDVMTSVGRRLMGAPR
jgi:pyruvyltransferase